MTHFERLKAQANEQGYEVAENIGGREAIVLRHEGGTPTWHVYDHGNGVELFGEATNKRLEGLTSLDGMSLAQISELIVKLGGPPETVPRSRAQVRA